MKSTGKNDLKYPLIHASVKKRQEERWWKHRRNIFEHLLIMADGDDESPSFSSAAVTQFHNNSSINSNKETCQLRFVVVWVASAVLPALDSMCAYIAFNPFSLHAEGVPALTPAMVSTIFVVRIVAAMGMVYVIGNCTVPLRLMSLLYARLLTCLWAIASPDSPTACLFLFMANGASGMKQLLQIVVYSAANSLARQKQLTNVLESSVILGYCAAAPLGGYIFAYFGWNYVLMASALITVCQIVLSWLVCADLLISGVGLAPVAAGGGQQQQKQQQAPRRPSWGVSTDEGDDDRTAAPPSSLAVAINVGASSLIVDRKNSPSAFSLPSTNNSNNRRRFCCEHDGSSTCCWPLWLRSILFQVQLSQVPEDFHTPHRSTNRGGGRTSTGIGGMLSTTRTMKNQREDDMADPDPHPPLLSTNEPPSCGRNLLQRLRAKAAEVPPVVHLLLLGYATFYFASSVMWVVFGLYYEHHYDVNAAWSGAVQGGGDAMGAVWVLFFLPEDRSAEEAAKEEKSGGGDSSTATSTEEEEEEGWSDNLRLLSWRRVKRYPLKVLVALLVQAFTGLGFMAPSLTVTVIAHTLYGCAFAYGNGALNNLVVQHAPAHIYTKVVTYAGQCIYGGTIIAFAIGPLLLQLDDRLPLFVAVVVLLVVFLVISSFWRRACVAAPPPEPHQQC